MSVRPEVRALPPYVFKAKPYRVKLDQNESAYDLPEAVKTRVLTRMAEVAFHRYSELHAESLAAALAHYHGWPVAGIAVAGGSNVLIQALTEACGLGAQVLTVRPTFAVYAMQATLKGAALREVPLRADFSLSSEELKAALGRGSGVFFLANPAAPTGNVFTEAELRPLIEAALPNWTVVLDEAYHQFARSDFSTLVRDYPHVVSLRTFSKAFGLGGVRLGYALCRPEMAEQLNKVTMPFSVSSLQVAVGLAVLEDPGFVETRVAEVERERARVFAALTALEGVTPYPSRTNFILFKVAEAATFFAGLLAQGVLVRRQDHLLPGCLRVTIGTSEENTAFLKAALQVAAQQVEAPPVTVPRG